MMADMKQTQFIFEGTPIKLHIVSNNMSYFNPPGPGDEVEQHFTISANGRVWFSAYAADYRSGKDIKTRTKNFSIGKDAAMEVLNKVSTYFSEEYTEVFATDIGSWNLKITNTDGKTYEYKGSACAKFEVSGIDLSDLIRDALGIQDLYVFDGNDKPDEINRIILDYHITDKIKPKEIAEGTSQELETADYIEQLIIDRETGSIEYIKSIGTKCKVSRKYEIEDGIKNLIDDFSENYLFNEISDSPYKKIAIPNEENEYTITIDYKKKSQRVITGIFDKYGLPDDFDYFASTVFDFIYFYDSGKIFNPSIYGQTKRCNTDYIFCKVIFDKGQKTYYYLTDDDSIEVGDFVLVYAGKDNHEAVVEVVNKEYFNKDNVPLPVENTKWIICKYIDESS